MSGRAPKPEIVALEPDWVIGTTPSWGDAIAGDVIRTLSDRRTLFPCTFAVAGLRQGSLRFAFVDGDSVQEQATSIMDALRTYLTGYRELGRNTSLITLFRPEAGIATLEDYRDRFWAILQSMHDQDPDAWPGDLPEDPDDPLWEFAAFGEPIFVVCNTPAHKQRLSRHAPNFMITFQPRWVFELIGSDTPNGRAARRTVRGRLAKFDDLPASPDLGDYGDPANREFRQYFLTDGNEPDGYGCPFLARQAAVQAAERRALTAARPGPPAASPPPGPGTPGT